MLDDNCEFLWFVVVLLSIICTISKVGNGMDLIFSSSNTFSFRFMLLKKFYFGYEVRLNFYHI